LAVLRRGAPFLREIAARAAAEREQRRWRRQEAAIAGHCRPRRRSPAFRSKLLEAKALAKQDPKRPT
jgi:hypothetical protein